MYNVGIYCVVFIFINTWRNLKIAHIYIFREAHYSLQTQTFLAKDLRFIYRKQKCPYKTLCKHLSM